MKEGGLGNDVGILNNAFGAKSDVELIVIHSSMDGP